MNQFKSFSVKIPQNGELLELQHVYTAGQQLRKSVGASGDTVMGDFLFLDGQLTTQKHVTKKAASDLKPVLEQLKYIFSQHGMDAHFIELSMFDPSDPHLQAFFFALYSDNSAFIHSYRKEMETNMTQELQSSAKRSSRGMLVPNPALYAFPVIGLKHQDDLGYKRGQKESLYLGIFPGRLPASSEDDPITPGDLDAVEKKTKNFMKSVLVKLGRKRGGNAPINTALTVTFPRPAGNGRIFNVKLKLRGGSVFVYGDAKNLTTKKPMSTEELTMLGLKISTILSRSVMKISQSQIEFQSSRRDMLRWFVHDAPKPLLIIRDFYLPEIRDCANVANSSKALLKTCDELENQIDFAMANFHAYGFLGGAGLKWKSERQTMSIRSLVKTVLTVVTPDAGAIKYVPQVADIKCFVDPQKYMAMLFCLLDNAIKATSGNSKFKRKRRIDIVVKKQGAFFTTSVTDNGCGIDKEDIDKIGKNGFHKFDSPDLGLKVVSSGLGLEIVTGFLKMVKSELKAKSKRNRGSTFGFKLPMKRI